MKSTSILLFVGALAPCLGANVRGLSTVGQVAKLRLIDSDTDQPIPAFDPLPITSIVDLVNLTTSNINIEAVTNGPVGSIQWNYNGALRTENTPVWSLCGNTGPDFLVCQRLKIGANATITVTPFSGKDATGVRGQSVTVNFAVIKSTLNPPVSMTLTLINADTDAEIGPLTNDTVIDISATPNVNIRANVEPAILIGSVEFATNGKLTRIENGAPYAAYGNKRDDYFAWRPTVGSYTVTSAAFSRPAAKGIKWSSFAVSFAVQQTMLPDTEPPKLLGLKPLCGIVDTATGPGSCDVLFTIQDNQSGLKQARIGPRTGLDDVQTYVPPTPTGNRVFEFNLTFDFPQGYNGISVVDVELTDNAGNTFNIYSDCLQELGFDIIYVGNLFVPYTFFALTPTVVDVSNGPANVTFQLSVVSRGVQEAALITEGPQGQVDAVVTLDRPVEGLQVLNLTMEIPAFIRPATYKLLSLSLTDFSGYNVVLGNNTFDFYQLSTVEAV